MKRILLAVAFVLGIGMLLPFSGVSAQAIDAFDQCTDVEIESSICESSGEGGDDLPSMAQIIVNTLLVLLGMVAVVMIVVGGFRYTLSRGEASEIKTAKDIILYAIIGLIVAIMAYAIVNFVLGWF